MREILNYQYFGNNVKEYLLSLAVFIASLIILYVFKKTILRKAKKITQKTKIDIDDLFFEILDSINWPFYFVVSVFVTSKFLILTGVIGKIINYLTLIVVTYYFARAVMAVIDYGFDKLEKKRNEDEEEAGASFGLIRKTVKIMLWLIVGILVLQNLGYEITALVTGLGIGGVAIAFALQNVLTDIFASFSIFFDKPFKVGDFIVIGKDAGTVKRVGIKSTRLETLQGEELVISNKELTETRVHNYKRMKKRRVSFNIGIIYETSNEKLKKIPEIINKIIENTEKTDVEWVRFKKFGDFSLIYEVVYYLNSEDYNEYMDVRQKINLDIKEKLEEASIEMAYPTQALYIKK